MLYGAFAQLLGADSAVLAVRGEALAMRDAPHSQHGFGA